MKRLFPLVLTLLLAAAAWAGQTWQVTILHTNDLHGMWLPFKYAGHKDYVNLEGGGGLARRATAIKQLRAAITDHPVVVIDAGDAFTRGPWHTQFYGVPEMEAFNLIGYDMMCVGNNEFKAKETTESQAIMLGLARRCRFPWLAANLTVGETGQPPAGILPFIVRDYNGVRVGYLGVTAPRSKDYAQTKGWTISDPIAAAKTWVPQVRKECDILIAVTHIGDELDKQLAAQVAGIDAIVGGDSHTYLPTPLVVKNPDGVDVPIVQAGEQGIVLGRFDLTFEQTDAWHLKSFSGKLIPIDKTIPDDPAMQKLLDRWLAPVAPVPVGWLPQYGWAAA